MLMMENWFEFYIPTIDKDGNDVDASERHHIIEHIHAFCDGYTEFEAVGGYKRLPQENVLVIKSYFLTCQKDRIERMVFETAFDIRNKLDQHCAMAVLNGVAYVV